MSKRIEVFMTIQQGWQCPACKTIYAPYCLQCLCERKVNFIPIWPYYPYWNTHDAYWSIYPIHTNIPMQITCTSSG